MFYQSHSDISVGDHPVAAVEEVETVDNQGSSSNRNQISFDSDVVVVEPDVVVVDITTQAASFVPMNTESSSVVSTTTPPKKRIKLSLKEPTPEQSKLYDEDNDDGSMCPICFDSWEISGPHRLVSLKCGHLFGESCIRRWITECNANSKVCPSCKRKANLKEIRSIYAKRILAIDKTQEHHYKDLLEREKNFSRIQGEKIHKLESNLMVQNDLIALLQDQVNMLKKSSKNAAEASTSSMNKPKIYRLFMEKNIEIAREGGGKVMVYCKRLNTLLVTQKSTQTLFPGYGLRFIDSTTFRPGQFLPASTKQIRDLSLDVEEQHLLTTSLDKGAKLFDIQQRRVVSVFSAEDKTFWAAAFDHDRPKYIYLGSQQGGGSTYVYDIRNPQTFVDELKIEGDATPVVKICPVAAREDFPFGGFFVCKFNSIWFYEYTASQQLFGTKLAVEGTFISMTYEEDSQYLLISARPTIQHPRSRYIIAELMKTDDTTSIRIWGTCMGSIVQKVMSRSTQIRVDTKNTIVAAYLEDAKSLNTWNAPSCTQISSAVLTEPVLDLCPMYLNNKVYLSALTDCKCRVYQLQVVNDGNY